MPMTHIFLFIGTIMVVGIVTIIQNRLKLCNHIRMLNHYRYICKELSDKTNLNHARGVFSKEASWVLSNTDVIIDIIKPSSSDSISDLKNYIVYNKSIGINDNSTRLTREIYSWISQIENKRYNVTLQLFNPFIWFYRGIESILMIVAGYPIKQFYPGFDFESNPWKVVKLVFTIVSGLSSIIGFYLTANSDPT